MQNHCSARVLARLLGDLPGLLLVDVLVHAVGEEHDLADRLAELARLVVGGDRVGEAAHLEEDRRRLVVVGRGRRGDGCRASCA